ncbi:uncharacterized protein LOC120354079 [Nilaparvata lugens]|uniref:uncharacterized protein LOC120354079 n=1 Tax=Nilaparvata lugens TaxID=108931 RepID=UPI00193CA28C|nr:uncharacterized protein LOC120354079 [Nilaparvata lugens]
MEETQFLRKYIKFFQYDKPYNSLPFFLLVILATVSLSSICLATRTELTVEISLEALKDAFSATLLYSCIIEHSLNPDRALKLVKLIEDKFLVDENDFVAENKEKWGRLDKLQEKKKQDMKRKFRYITIAQFFICFGYYFKNFLNYILGIRTYLDDDTNRWPTPFLYPIPEFQFRSTIFLLYVYSLHALTLSTICSEGYIMLTTVCVSTERVLADFETLYLLLDNFSEDFNEEASMGEFHKKHIEIDCKTKDERLKADMRRIVNCHQSINRNLNICAKNSAFVVSVAIAVIVADSCSNAFFMLKTTDVKKAVISTSMFIIENMTMFFLYQNGQRIYNQNQILRKYLTELPWTDKPLWLRRTLHVMMTRANVDSEMRPYGIFVLNYVSFKDVMKLTFSVGNVLYSMKVASQS